MSHLKAYDHPAEKYTQLRLRCLDTEYKIYVPIPHEDTVTNETLTRSILEIIVQQCSIPGLKVNGDQNIMIKTDRRTHGQGISPSGVPNLRDVIKALVEIGYKDGRR